MRFERMDNDPLLNRLKKLESASEMLWEFIENATEAIWCIEFPEPVDLMQPEHEIVRQVFEHPCYWRMCNRAMARLYDLPDGMDLNTQPVSMYFPRSPENEAFIRDIIEGGYHIDSVPSVDLRHDGSIVYVENSVRCHIRDSRLYRMYGTARDVTQQTHARKELLRREQEIRGVLNAIPDAVLVLDHAGVLVAANPAFEALFGWSVESWLGKDVAAIYDLKPHVRALHRRAGTEPVRFSAAMRCADGGARCCEVMLGEVLEGEHNDRIVAVLRPVADALCRDEEPRLQQRSAG